MGMGADWLGPRVMRGLSLKRYSVCIHMHLMYMADQTQHIGHSMGVYWNMGMIQNPGTLGTLQ